MWCSGDHQSLSEPRESHVAVVVQSRPPSGTDEKQLPNPVKNDITHKKRAELEVTDRTHAGFK